MKASEKITKLVIDNGKITDEYEKQQFRLLLSQVITEAKTEAIEELKKL